MHFKGILIIVKILSFSNPTFQKGPKFEDTRKLLFIDYSKNTLIKLNIYLFKYYNKKL